MVTPENLQMNKNSFTLPRPLNLNVPAFSVPDEQTIKPDIAQNTGRITPNRSRPIQNRGRRHGTKNIHGPKADYASSDWEEVETMILASHKKPIFL